ncbi:MAG: glycosyltransferase family 2 protein [Flavobacteriaceae bacterium]|nr:glycosyltransferase family 2 protein [Flavobacteriaceae bacterium]
MEASPLVSIIVPTYKRTEYLRLTLESMLSQTYQNIEIIVVDDGSPGNENAQLCDQYPKVSYRKIENSGGPARPRNTGIKMAKGELIAFTDDDDIWLPEKLEKQIAILKAHPEYGLVHGPCMVIDENGTRTGEIIGKPGSPDVKHGDVKLRMMGNWTLMTPTPLIRRVLVKNVGFFSEEMPAAGEDTEFWIRCSFYTRFYYLDEPLVEYRKHDSNISSNNEKYIQLPLYLNVVRKKQLVENRITKLEGKQLLMNLSQMQLKMVKFRTFKVFKNMFTLDPLWFLKVKNFKILAKKIIR